MAVVELDGVWKVYGRDVVAVRDLSLRVDDGELLVLVGPSGCGKSTTLRVVAGLEEATAGEVRIGGRAVTDLPPGERDVAFVFQSAAVLPHLTVADNIGFGLKLRRRRKAEIDERVAEVASLLRLDGLLDRRPHELSGGQRQRVAIGRAMLRDPRAFLMDEPLSSLDARLRVQLRGEIGRLQRRLGTTTLYVTHDQGEAMTLGDRVAVLRDGVLEQVDTPRTVYDRPATAFVACTIGAPGMNLLAGQVDAGEVAVSRGRLRFSAPVRLPDGPVVVGIRPADLLDASTVHDGRPSFDVVVEAVEHVGPAVHVVFTSSGDPVDVPGVDGDDGRVVAALDPTAAVRAGAPLRLAVDPGRVHLFDAATGARLGP